MDSVAIACQLEALLTPAITAQPAYYRQLRLRERIEELAIDSSLVNSHGFLGLSSGMHQKTND